jgi:hypothetical protein
MTTAIDEREKLHRIVDEISDEKVLIALDFINSLENGDEPNEETVSVLNEISKGHSLIGPFNNLEQLKASLLSDIDA